MPVEGDLRNAISWAIGEAIVPWLPKETRATPILFLEKDEKLMQLSVSWFEISANVIGTNASTVF